MVMMLLLNAGVYCQQNFCADSSIRVKYIFGYSQSTLFANPDTAGTNIFTGEYLEGGKFGIALLKTNWGDSIFWAKKLHVTGKDVANRNSFAAPNGTIVSTGIWGGAVANNPEILISRIDTNGNVQWAKRFKFSPVHLHYDPDSRVIKNILIANNAIYFTATFNSYYGVIAKLDLDGNIIWSKSFGMNLPFSSGLGSIPVYYNNSLIFLASVKNQQTPGPGSELYTVITKLNDADGSISESNAYKTITDTLIKGLSSQYIKYNTDNSFSLTGYINIEIVSGTGMYAQSNIVLNSLLDANLNPVHNYYYKNNIPLNGSETYFDFNNQKQHAFLSGNVFKPTDKYFVTFDKNDNVLRSRKLSLPSTYGTIYRNSLNFDDKENLHFVYQYTQGSQFVSEYARISNFSSSGTLGCVGKDTSILTKYDFTLNKEPFTWDNITSNVLISNPVSFIEDTAIVTKELVCKIVSRCDSVHINGPASACIGQPVRYTVSKNSGCFKNLDWIIDTSFADIVNAEGDSAINIRFKKPFTGYIHAALTDCVVKDSFFVKAVAALPRPLINRTDSLLCPGKTLTLAANNGFTNYLWQSSTAGQQLVVNAAGMYKVTALDSCNNLKTDSINITLSDTSLNLIPTQTICLFDTAFIVLPADVINITWQPTSNSLQRNNILVAYPSQSTVYNITAERQANCPIGKNSEVIIKTCPQTVFIPNSFTPNNDGRNDIFKPAISQPLALYRFTIYNRYGQTVFETTSQSAGWDGKYKGALQPQGGYMYQCSYRFNGGAEKNLKGYCMLIR